MKDNPLKSLQEYGQSVWLDYIRRSLITRGELKRLIDEDTLRGVTANPAIFEKAIAGSTDYDAQLQELSAQNLDANSIYERLAIQDIQDAADLFRDVYAQTKRRDGYVSLEVSPKLAHDTRGTIEEARRFWKAIDRENVMIKVPGTQEGIPAIEQLTSEGINVNVTLLFSQEAYEQSAEAYIGGLQKLASRGGDLSRIASVASFFVSRIDTAVDTILTSRLKSSTDANEQQLLRDTMGKVAIANAKQAYQRYLRLFGNARWKALATKGAQTQRVLWASTGTKNPKYRDVLYIEELIGPDTVNTVPPSTLDAFRDHGNVRPSLTEDVEGANSTMIRLAQLGISMKQVTDQLLQEGVSLFDEALNKLLQAVVKRCAAAKQPKINRMSYKLPEPFGKAVKDSIEDWRMNQKVRRLWERDASLWTGKDEANWLGWLAVTERKSAHLHYLTNLTKEVQQAGFTDVLLLGMGGSSLCPEVLKMTFGKIERFPELHVLDSTDPAQLRSFEKRLDFRKTLFIVSSKSGTTLEPNIFKQYFFERAKDVIGEKEAGDRFIAITDPGSKLQQVAENDRFRYIFFGVPSIGGRYSALSDFGMAPAAAVGIDVPKFLERAEEMIHACVSCVPVEENPGAVLGIILGVLARNGRDKVTITASPGIRDLGAWLEQLLAESTGKSGKGLIPVDREELAAPESYGSDRVFAYIRLESAPDPRQDAAIDALEWAGHPVIRIAVDETYDLGEEFFRWEFATATAGSILGINAFDQPDVEASKVATRELTSEYEKTGSLASETPIMEKDGLKLFTDQKNLEALRQSAEEKSLSGYLAAHLNRIKAGDYFAISAFIEMNEANEGALQEIRLLIRDRKRVATCLGFGPRFLHSTGQAYKGGPNSGVFLQITCDDAEDIPVPGQKYTFGLVKAAQARGDFQVIAERNRRILRVHLPADVRAGMKKLQEAVKQALK
jgi:transaldolase / glucose-6-phosphate isomerase